MGILLESDEAVGVDASYKPHDKHATTTIKNAVIAKTRAISRILLNGVLPVSSRLLRVN
jgi:hypothetical protein